MTHSNNRQIVADGQTRSRINAGVLTPVGIAATCAVAALFMASPAWAANSRSWVSVHGSDLNNCTSVAPCRSFQHAHDATVDGGEVDTMDPGDYGTLNVTKSITIDGGNMGYIQVPINGVGITVNAPAVAGDSPGLGAIVVLRNLSIEDLDGPAFAYYESGILWHSGQSLSIEGVSFKNLEAAIDADAAGPAQLLVKDVTIRYCLLAGVSIESPGTEAVVDHTTIEYVYYGFRFDSGGKATITNSVISYATAAAIQAGNTSSEIGPEINLEDSSILYSAVGLNIIRSTTRIAGNNIHDNTVGMQTLNIGQIVSFGDNRIMGNASGESPSFTTVLK